MCILKFRRVVAVLVTVGSMLAASMAAQAATGRTAGAFNVSATGAATYQIPIWVPPGPKGVQPNLALTYNSQGGGGTMGPGWSLSGLSSITRCNKTFAQDGDTAGPVALIVSDGYCLDGNRLRLTGGTYGAAGSTYQTEIANFSLVTANGTAGNGPASFTVQGKDGLIYEYGNTTDSRIIATPTATASQWLLNKVSDRTGNNYIVTYQTGQPGSAGIGVPLTISYTPSSAGSSSYNYTVHFIYSPQSDFGLSNSVVGYIAGTLVDNTNLLASVTIKDSTSTVLRKYKLSYQAAPSTVRARLTQVKECADDAQTDCLSPTAITYHDQAEQTGLADFSNWPRSIVAEDAAADIDGDGRMDIVSQDAGGALYVQFSNTTGGFGAPVNTGVTIPSYPILDDFLGEGRVSLLVPQNGIWYVVRWNGSAFVSTSTGLAVDPNLAPDAYQALASADINGDGLPDLVSVSTDGKVYARLNTSVGGVVSFAPTAALFYTAACASPTIKGNNAWESNSVVRHMDFNGDGREDVMLICPRTVATDTIITLLSQATSFSAGQTFHSYMPVEPLNWNNDSCTDFFNAGPINAGSVFISGCDGTVTSAVSLPGEFAVRYVLFDWDGDGRTDVLMDGVISPSTAQVYRSTGDGVAGAIATSIPLSDYFNGALTLDQNGDGLDDLVLMKISGQTFHYSYALHNASIPPDLVTSITDGYGVAYKPTYVSITQSNYTKGSDATYPEKDVLEPMYVVSQVAITDASGFAPTYTQSFTYTGARRDMQGRGFLGFQSITVTDSRNVLIGQTYYKTAFPYTGMVSEQGVYQDGFFIGWVPISYTVNTPGLITLDTTANNQRYFPYVASTATDTYEVSGSKYGKRIAHSSASFTYDNYGNLTGSTSTVTDKDSTTPQSPTYNQSWTTAVTNTITPNTANWCLGLPTQTVVTKSGTGAAESAISRLTRFTPDYVKCRITQQVVSPNSATYNVTTDLGYDNFGNVNSTTVTGINMTPRTTTIDWGTTGQFPMSVTNAMAQTTSFGYDFGKGVQASQTDPNGLITSWQYDSFGRTISETRPDNTSTTWSYNDCSVVSGGCQNGDPASAATGINRMVVTETSRDTAGTALSDTWTYLDQLDRPIASKSKTLNGGYSRTGVQYDSMGRKYRETVPCDAYSCTAYWNTWSYDMLNRVTQIQRPISAGNSALQETTIAYQGMTTVSTDPQSKQTTKVTDPNGWLRRSRDANGYYQSFTYDAFGNLKAVVDSASNTLFSASYAYGIGAFQTQTVDMDLGTWNYTPNALGEVVSYTDARGSAFTMTYDPLSRPLTRSVDSDGTTTWTWGNDAASFNIGQLQSINNTANNPEGSTETYTYDNLGRLSQRQIVSDATYNFNYTYSATTGLPETVTYPTSTSGYRLALKYIYQNGMLQQVKDNAASTVFWQANAVNARGQITQETLGNNIVTNRSYDVVTGWINSIQSGVGGGTGVQNESYLFDTLGNVTQRQNNTLGLTESFCYDAVYRLTRSALSGDSTCTTNNNLTVGYDNLGNITNRSDVANNAAWTYHPTKKHAVTQAGSTTYAYTYDA